MSTVAYINSTSIHVVWNPLPKVTLNGKVFSYRICHKEWSSLLPCQDSAFVQDGITSYTITKLKPYTQYTIEISAGTIAGYGPPFVLRTRTNESGTSHKDD